MFIIYMYVLYSVFNILQRKLKSDFELKTSMHNFKIFMQT